MTSKSEQILCRTLRAILANLPVGADIDISPEFQADVLRKLEYFLPTVLCELHGEWQGECFDATYPVLARKVNDGEMELFAQCILIGDQTLVPVHLLLQIATSKDEVSWLDLKVGERLTGERGETGKRGMRRVPYEKLYSALHRIQRLNGDADKLDWRYNVTFGDKRNR